MAATKKLEAVTMYGEGNFSIGGDTYSFKNGEEVTPKSEEHAKMLEAEAARRKALQGVGKPKDTKG